MTPRERALVEETGVAYDIAAGMMAGQYRTTEGVTHGGVRLSPVVDHEPLFFVDDRTTDDCIGVVNAGAVETARELVETVERVAEEGGR
jgi:hypothetical protein